MSKSGGGTGNYNTFGEQKLDLVYFSTDAPDPFKELALMEGVEL